MSAPFGLFPGTQSVAVYRSETINIEELVPDSLAKSGAGSQGMQDSAHGKCESIIFLSTFDRDNIEHRLIWILPNATVIGIHWSGAVKITMLPDEHSPLAFRSQVTNVKPSLFVSLDRALCGLSRRYGLSDLRQFRKLLRANPKSICDLPVEERTIHPDMHFDVFDSLWATIACLVRSYSLACRSPTRGLPIVNPQVARWLAPLSTRERRSYAITLEPVALSLALQTSKYRKDNRLARRALLQCADGGLPIRRLALDLLKVSRGELRYLNEVASVNRLSLGEVQSIGKVFGRLPPQRRPSTFLALQRLVPLAVCFHKHYLSLFSPEFCARVPNSLLKEHEAAFWSKTSNTIASVIKEPGRLVALNGLPSVFGIKRFANWIETLDTEDLIMVHRSLSRLGISTLTKLAVALQSCDGSFDRTKVYARLAEEKSSEVWTALGIEHVAGCPTLFNLEELKTEHVSVRWICGSDDYQEVGTTDFSNCLGSDSMWAYHRRALSGEIFTCKIEARSSSGAVSKSLFTLLYRQKGSRGSITLSEHRGPRNETADAHSPIVEQVISVVRRSIASFDVRHKLHVGHAVVNQALRDLKNTEAEELKVRCVDELCRKALLPHSATGARLATARVATGNGPMPPRVLPEEAGQEMWFRRQTDGEIQTPLQ